MSETVYKCYLRDCGVEGKFIVLEAGKIYDGNEAFRSEFAAFCGHYYKGGTYDDIFTYVKRKSEEDLKRNNELAQEQSLRIAGIPSFKSHNALEEDFENCLWSAKIAIFKEFLKPHIDEVQKQEDFKLYELDSAAWKEVCLNTESLPEYKEFFFNVCCALQPKDFDISILEKHCN